MVWLKNSSGLELKGECCVYNMGVVPSEESV